MTLLWVLLGGRAKGAPLLLGDFGGYYGPFGELGRGREGWMSGAVLKRGWRLKVEE